MLDIRELARQLRLAVVQQQYDVGNLTEEEARGILAGPLSPGDDTSIVDDSGQHEKSATFSYSCRRPAQAEES